MPEHLQCAILRPMAMVLAALLVSGCQPGEQSGRTDRTGKGMPAGTPPAARHVPPPAPGPNFRSGRTIASPGVADTADLSAEQMTAMFYTAIAQARPDEDKAAICVGMQGLSDGQVRDAPSGVVERLAGALRLPAVPASQCGFDVTPFVIATHAKAILYTVRVEARDRRDALTFWAVATYGNLGANGTQFRLVRDGDRWRAERTGLSVTS